MIGHGAFLLSWCGSQLRGCTTFILGPKQDPFECPHLFTVVDPLIKAWESGGHPERYAQGTWGPDAANELISVSGGGRWIDPGPEPDTG